MRVMGVLNVTPDSFSDGGLHDTVDNAIAHGLTLLDEGADIIDIGGESTRPGATPVDEATEIRRAVPVIEGLLAERPGTVISIDTSKGAVADAAAASAKASHATSSVIERGERVMDTVRRSGKRRRRVRVVC